MSAPIGNTCPDINACIKQVKSALKNAERGKKECEKGTDAYDYFNEIENDLWRMEDALEDLRNANSTLRGWGEENEARIDELENTIYELEQKQTA